MFELVVAIGLVSLILLALVGLATVSVRNASYSRNQAAAARLGQEAIEWMRSERDRGWNDFVSQVSLNPVRCIKTTDWDQDRVGKCQEGDQLNGMFYREAGFTTADINGDSFFDRVEVLVTVYWTDSRGYHEIKNSIYYTDWKAQ